VTVASQRLEEGDLLTIEQVRRLLPLGRSTIYALVKTGQLPCYRVRAAGSRRGRLLIARRDLEAYLDRARQAAPRAPTRVDVDGLLRKVRRA
jgi:excisionase family DNA binding protein